MASPKNLGAKDKGANFESDVTLDYLYGVFDLGELSAIS
jgi:hypothetical protein